MVFASNKSFGGSGKLETWPIYTSHKILIGAPADPGQPRRAALKGAELAWPPPSSPLPGPQLLAPGPGGRRDGGEGAEPGSSSGTRGEGGRGGMGGSGGALSVPGETEARCGVTPLGRGSVAAPCPRSARGGPGRCSPPGRGSCSRCRRAAAPRRHLWGFCKPLIVVSTD